VIHPIEYQGEKVVMVAGSHQILSLTGEIAWAVPPGATIAVCAWCKKGGEVETELKRQHFTLTHGICPACLEVQKRKIENERKNHEQIPATL
jgi:hypothetical protein